MGLFSDSFNKAYFLKHPTLQTTESSCLKFVYFIENLIIFKGLYYLTISSKEYSFGWRFIIFSAQFNAPVAKISLDVALCLKIYEISLSTKVTL